MSRAPRAALAVTACLAAVVLGGCGGAAAGAAVPTPSDPPVPWPTAPPGRDVDPFAPASGTAAPCEVSFTADPTGNHVGERTPEGALESWLAGTATETLPAPAAAPRDGWSAEEAEVEGERSFVSAEWHVLARESFAGRWMVTALGCVTPSDGAAAP